MAKKSRRTRNTPRLTAAQLAGAGESRMPARSEGGTPGSPRNSLAREDYSFVFSDLRRIAVLAGSLLLVMIILSFVLPQFIR